VEHLLTMYLNQDLFVPSAPLIRIMVATDMPAQLPLSTSFGVTASIRAAECQLRLTNLSAYPRQAVLETDVKSVNSDCFC